MSAKISLTDKKFFQIGFQRPKIHRDAKFQRDRKECLSYRHLPFILTFLKIKVIYNFILTFFVVNFLMKIHLRTFI